MSTVRNIRLQHAQIGIASEGGELAGALKKVLFYGRELDTVNVAEELGDLLWYMALAANELGISLESIMERNIAKLAKRYGDKFSEERATTRNLHIERNILEGTMRPATDRDDHTQLICDRCGERCLDVPFYCMHCGIDFGRGGGVVMVRSEHVPRSE